MSSARDPGKPPPPDNPNNRGYRGTTARGFLLVAAILAVIIATTLLFAPDHDPSPSDCDSVELTINGQPRTYVPRGCE